MRPPKNGTYHIMLWHLFNNLTVIDCDNVKTFHFNNKLNVTESFYFLNCISKKNVIIMKILALLFSINISIFMVSEFNTITFTMPFVHPSVSAKAKTTETSRVIILYLIWYYTELAILYSLIWSQMVLYSCNFLFLCVKL